MSSVTEDLASLSRDVNSRTSEDNIPRLIFIFSKELYITPSEFMNLEIPMIFDLLEELNRNNKEQERALKKRR